MPSTLPPQPPSCSWLYSSIFNITYAFVHGILTLAAALLQKDSSRQTRSVVSPLRYHDDIERGDFHNKHAKPPSAAHVTRQQSYCKPPTRQQCQQQLARQSSKKNVQFDFPKRRACPPLGRIDIIAASDCPPATDDRSPMRLSLDRIRSTASYSRAHHATYFLE